VRAISWDAGDWPAKTTQIRGLRLRAKTERSLPALTQAFKAINVPVSLQSANMASSIFTHLLWRLRIYTFQTLISILAFSRRIRPPPLPERPTHRKFYSVRPNLVCFVWIPSSYKAGSSPLPLLIDIHGGGFCIGHPTLDDSSNVILCHKYNICVVSINYRKAPQFPFPTAVQDAAALIDAILNDPELPVDKTKVAVCGYSAGGNLSLTATQVHDLNKRIKGVVSFYPATAVGRPLAERLKKATPSPDSPDVLLSLTDMFTWAYVPEGQDLHDPLLSPLYAKRENLPPKLYILGCEYDMLCAEAREMAEKMANSEEAKQKEELGNGRDGWQCGSITWEEIKGVQHGFNQIKNFERNPEVKKILTEKTDQMFENIAKWLFKEVYGER